MICLNESFLLQQKVTDAMREMRCLGSRFPFVSIEQQMFIYILHAVIQSPYK